MTKHIRGIAFSLAILFTPLSTFAFPDFSHKSDMEKFLFAAFKSSLDLLNNNLPARIEDIKLSDGRTYTFFFSPNARSMYLSFFAATPFAEFGAVLRYLISTTNDYNGTKPEDITFNQFKTFLKVAEESYEGKTVSLEKSLSALLKGTGFNQEQAKNDLNVAGITFEDTEDGIIKGLSETGKPLVLSMTQAAKDLKAEKKLGHRVHKILHDVLHGENKGTILKTGLPFHNAQQYIQNYSFKVPASNITAFRLVDLGIKNQ